jgi:hypothetical protein
MGDDFEISLGAEFERQLAMIPKCNVFKIPPLNQADGYRCTGWEGGHMWTGRCRVLAKGNSARVVLDDPSTGKVFAEAPLDHPNAVEPVLDSSRYFVLRVVNGTRHAFIGIGFQERNEAFDFKLACGESKKAAEDFEASQTAAAAGPQPIKSSGTDWSLQPGQKIQISTEGKPATRKKREIAPGAFKLTV